MIKVKEEPDKYIEVYGVPVNLNKRYLLKFSFSGEKYAKFIEFVFSGGAEHTHTLIDKMVEDITKGY